MKNLKIDRFFILIICLILFSRFLLVIFGKNLLGDDGNQYLVRAESYLKHKICVFEPNSDPVFHDVPLYPLLLAFILFFTKSMPGLVIKIAGILNAIFFTIGALGVFYFAFKISRKKTIGYLSMILFSISPESIPYSVFCMPDSLFLAVFIWSNLYLLNYLYEDKLIYLIISFLLWGLSVLIKPISLFYFIIISIIVLVLDYRRIFIERVFGVIFGILIGITIIAPWPIRNYFIYNSLTISPKMDLQLFYYHYYNLLVEITGDKEKAGRVLRQQETEIKEKYKAIWDNPLMRVRLLGNWAKKQIMHELARYLSVSARRHIRLYLGTGTVALLRMFGNERAASALEMLEKFPSFSHIQKIPWYAIVIQMVSWIFLLIIYGFVLLGFYNMFRIKNYPSLIILIAGLFYFIIIIGGTPYTRYRLSILPFFSILASYSFYGDKIKSKRNWLIDG